jgi:ubiquinone biosynthesis protein
MVVADTSVATEAGGEQTLPKALLLNLGRAQQKKLRGAFDAIDGDPRKQIKAVESILQSSTGQLWRENIAHWLTHLLNLEFLVPDIYAHWRLLARDSLSFLLSQLSPARLAPKLVEQLGLAPETPVPVRLLSILSRMPGLQKLGQVVARNRHLDPALKAALSQLENSISDVEFESILRVLKEDLRAQLATLGVEIEDHLMSEATVSAVVRFSWVESDNRERRRGVFKVIKPHIPVCFAEDMDLFERLSEFLASQQTRYGPIVASLPEVFQDVRLLLEHEVNFESEQKNLAEAGRFYAPIRRARVPQVISALSSKRITAMTEECCLKITEASTLAQVRAEQLVDALIARPLLATEPASMFHADPHAGNLMYDDRSEELILLDWALTEHLTLDQRRHMLMLGVMLAMRDKRGVATELAALSEDAPSSEVERQIARFIDKQPLFQLPGCLQAMKLLDTLAHQGLRFPLPLLMFRKALFTLDGVLHDIAGPVFDLDRVLLKSMVTKFPPIWISLLSASDWVAIQASGLLFGSRLWQAALPQYV